MKTFFQILGVIAVHSSLIVLAFFVYRAYNQAEVVDYKNTLEKCNDATGGLYMSQCYKAVIVQHLPTITFAVFVPILEFILYPVLARCRYFNNFDNI